MEKELINLLGEKIIELNKIKIVLLALWKYDIHQEEANKIIAQFEKELETKNFEATKTPEIEIKEIPLKEADPNWKKNIEEDEIIFAEEIKIENGNN